MISLKNVKKFCKDHTEEHRRKISEAMKGKPSQRKGKILSEETRRKMSEAAKRRKKNTLQDKVQ